MDKSKNTLETFFLPDLCNVRAIFVLILLSEALVTALVLTESGLTEFEWSRFATISYFVQWVALLSVALLCQSRRFLVRFDLKWAVAWSMGVLLLVSFSVSVGAEYLMFLSGAIPFAVIDWSWVARNLVISAIFGAMGLRYFYVQSQWKLKSQAELSSRLQALQARIRPHFFFNSLNTVASLIVVDPDKAETMLVDLSSLFRVVLKDQDKNVPLQQELELGERYLNIEQVRLGERLKLKWDLPEQVPDIQVPQLLLQPLLENAIYHGIQPLVDGGEVSISLSPQYAEDDQNKEIGAKYEKDGKCYWLLVIENDKPVVSEATAGNQVALPNIQMRLEAIFGPTASLRIIETDNQYKASIRLPEYTQNSATHVTNKKSQGL